MVSLIKTLSQKQNEYLLDSDLRQIKAKLLFAATQIEQQEAVKEELANFYNRLSEIIALPLTLKVKTFEEVNAINKFVTDLLNFNKLNISFCDLKSNNRSY